MLLRYLLLSARVTSSTEIKPTTTMRNHGQHVGIEATEQQCCREFRHDIDKHQQGRRQQRP